MTNSTVRFTLPCYPDTWTASYDGKIAAAHGVTLISETASAFGEADDHHVSVELTAPDMESALAFVTVIFSCDEDCTPEELMVIG